MSEDRPNTNNHEESGLDSNDNRSEDHSAGTKSEDDFEANEGNIAEEPLSDIADRLEKSKDEGELEDIPSDAFVEVSVDKIDHEAIWDELEGELDEEFEPTDEAEIKVIPKDEFCHKCKYFAAPPELKCNHEGTRIIELVDLEHYRVSDCPIVKEYERTGKTW